MILNNAICHSPKLQMLSVCLLVTMALPTREPCSTLRGATSVKDGTPKVHMPTPTLMSAHFQT